MSQYSSLKEDHLLTIDDLSRLFQTSRRGIYNRRHRGSLPPPIKVGSSLRWDPKVVAEFLETNQEGGLE